MSLADFQNIWWMDVSKRGVWNAVCNSDVAYTNIHPPHVLKSANAGACYDSQQQVPNLQGINASVKGSHQAEFLHFEYSHVVCGVYTKEADELMMHTQ